MSNPTADDLEQLKQGIAYLVASIVQTLGESDAHFKSRFGVTLEKAFNGLRQEGSESSAGVEVLGWTAKILERGIS